MNLWGAAPLIAAALLGGGTGAHTATAHGAIQRGAAYASAPSQSPAADPTPSVAPADISPGPVLNQVGFSQRWTTTVLLDGNTPACQGVLTSYWLDTGPPNPAVPGAATTSAVAVPQAMNPPAGSSCRVTVTFRGVRGIPKTAVLILDQAVGSSAIMLAVSRHVTLLYYLWIPVVAGIVIALAAFLLSALSASVYRPDGRRARVLSRDFWMHPILASGAWSANDSWATNITTIVTIIGTVLGTTTAVSAFIPGVAIDRFVIVNLIAGGIVAAAPLVFGILYAPWTSRNPGVTADATLRLPTSATTTMGSLKATQEVTLRKGTMVECGGEVARLGADSTAHLLSQATALVLRRGPAEPATPITATLPADIAVRLSPGTPLRLRGGRRRTARGKAAHAETRVTVLHGSAAALADETAVDRMTSQAHSASQSDSASQAHSASQSDSASQAHSASQSDSASQAHSASQSDSASQPHSGAPAVDGEVHAVEGPAATISVASGASITPFGNATVSSLGPGHSSLGPGHSSLGPGHSSLGPGHSSLGPGHSSPAPLAVKAGKAIQVPPGSYIGVPAGASLSLPGDANITVRIAETPPPQTSLAPDPLAPDPLAPDPLAPDPLAPDPLTQSGLTIVGDAGALTIPGDGDARPSDPFRYPVLITMAGSAKIVVTGTADVTLPRDTLITAPHRQASTLSRERYLQVPQGSGLITANLRTVLIAAFVTMFGIGMEIGIVAVLACGLSDASTDGRWGLFAAIMLVVLVLLGYAVSATRAIADPQPGSSVSATPGTSFTL
jgi:hypothetical protein